MPEFKDIDKARKLLGLGDYATLEEIKEAYKKLAVKYHPDKCEEVDKKKCGEMFKEVSQAKELITAYCAGYRYSFKEDDVNRSSISKEEYTYLKRFYDGWWGDLDI